MKTFYFRVSIALLMSIFLAGAVYAQPGDGPRNFERAKQRLMTMKKINLIEVLNLSEEKSDKFLSKYTANENKVMEISNNIDEATQDLHKLLESKTAKSSDLKQKSEAIIKLQDDLNAAVKVKFNDAQSILSEEEFAKFVVFERRFQDQLRKHIMKKPPIGKPGNPDNEEFRGGQRRNR